MAGSEIIDFIDNCPFLNPVIRRLGDAPAAEEKCNVNDLLQIINNIFDAIHLVKKDGDTRKDTKDVSESIKPSNISHLTQWISCQMACEVTRGKDLGERLSAIFERLSSYCQTTQVVLVLAALAMQYGEFWYFSEAPSAPSTGLLKGLSSLKKKLISDENKRAAITPLNDVVNDLSELTTCLVDLYKLVNEHRGKHMSELTIACLTIPEWICKTIIAILAAGNYFARLTDVDHRNVASELVRLKSIVSNRKSAVLTAFKACQRQIARMEYQKYVIKVRASGDIVDFMKKLLDVESSSQDLIVTGPNDEPVKFDSFRNKIVLLIISDLKISMDDIKTLESIHANTRQFPQYQTEERLYELVWIPIVDARHDNMEELQKFKSLMRWAFRVDPGKLNEWVATYIKEEWRFKRETMAVVLNSLGWVENTDAMSMLRIWGMDAFPYTATESTHLWRDSCNWVELVIKEPVVPRGRLDKIRTDYVLLYGGTDTVDAADVIAGFPNLSLVRIENKELFFTRLRSCLICRLRALQILKTEKPLSDDIAGKLCEAYKACQRGGFTILTKGRDLQMLHVGPLDTTLTVLKNQACGSDKDGRTNLAEVFKRKINIVQESSDCEHFYIPDYTGLGDLRCPKCNQFMRYDLSFMCCHPDSS